MLKVKVKFLEYLAKYERLPRWPKTLILMLAFLIVFSVMILLTSFIPNAQIAVVISTLFGYVLGYASVIVYMNYVQ